MRMMMASSAQVISIALLLMIKVVLGCEYASIDPRHTMCIYSPRSCSGKMVIRSGGLSCEDKKTILATHNHLRQMVALGQVRGQPAALNMRTLVWDDELANIAQRWADQCTPGHDKSRHVGRFPVGQNVAAVWTYEHDEGNTPDFPTQIEAWFNEVNQHGFPKGSVDPFRFSKPTGHYTQMVWAETYLVGCGYTYYVDPSRGHTKIYVCNYGPGGNVIGAPMYKIGFQGQPYCEDEGIRPSSAYQGLCDHGGANAQGSCGSSFLSGHSHASHGMAPPPPPSHDLDNKMNPPPHETNLITDEEDRHHHNHPVMMMTSGPGPLIRPGQNHPSHHPEFPLPPHLPDFPAPHGHHDRMKPHEVLMKNIKAPFMGLMKMLNPWNLINKFTG